MYAMNVFAAGALLSAVAAVPMAKRDIVWVTETEEDIVTVPVTQTVWINPGETPAHYGHHHAHSTVTSHVQSTVHITLTSSPVETSSSAESSSSYVAPSSSETPTTSSSSVYVAPTTSSTSEYIAPTTSSTSVYVAPTTSSTSVYVAPTTSSTSVYVAPTTSSTSVYVAPTTSSTSVYVAPTTSSTSVYVAPTTSTSAAPAATSSASSAPSGYGTGLGASGTEYTGDLTYFATGLGACGWTNTDSEAIVAISHVIFDSYSAEMDGNPNNNPLCGKYVTITGENGSPYQAKIVDRCPGCDEGSLDLTQTLFDTIEPTGNGRVHNVSWKFD